MTGRPARSRDAPKSKARSDTALSTSTGRTRSSLTLVTALGLLLALAAALRLHGLAYRDLWFDELGSVAMALTGNLWESEGGNPPLYFALLRIWMHIAGTDIAQIRVLSALFGVASVAALFWVAVELRLPAPARWWGAFLLACSPLHLYYSQEARAYALLVLLLLLAIGSFLQAIRTGNRWSWVAHGLSVAAGLYTHNMMIPMVGAFWAAAVVLGAPRARWRGLALAHALAVVAYGPWLPRLWQQAGGDSHRWIADLMREGSLMGLVLGTVEAFDIGGRLPGHLEFPANPATAPLAVLFFGVAGLMAIFGEHHAAPATSSGALLKRTGVLLLFTAWPLLFLVGYSWLNKPLYVVGRYDLPGHTSYLLLMGVGINALVIRLRDYGRAAARIPVLVLLVLTTAALTPKLTLGNRGADGHASARLATAFKAHSKPTDLVVALDISGPLASYAVLHAGVPLETAKFPGERLHNLDEPSLNRRVQARLVEFRQQAKSLAGVARGRRVWLVESPIYGDLSNPSHGYEVLKRLLMAELAHREAAEAPPKVADQVSVMLLEPE